MDEERYCLERVGMRPMAYMEDVGWVGDDVWYAHGIWFNDAEIHKMGACGCGVAHCPSSNMKLSSGTIPIRKLLDAGVKVGIGVDGSASNDASNMLWDMRMAYLLHKQLGGDSLRANEVLSLATRGSARVLGWEDAIGTLEVGKAADLFMLDAGQLGFAGALFDDEALPVTVGAFQADMTIVGGRVVVENGRLTGTEEELIAFRAQMAADRMAAAAAKRTGLDYRKRRG